MRILRIVRTWMRVWRGSMRCWRMPGVMAMRNPVRLICTAREEAALHELPLMAQVMYMRGLRPFLDASTGIVGIARRLSERGLAEVVTVPARPGRRAEHVVEPTRKQVRAALSALEAVGLIRPVRGVDRCFVFCLPLARQDKSDSRSRGQMMGQETEYAKPHGAAGFSDIPDDSRGQMMGPHQVKISNTTTEASYKRLDARAMPDAPATLVLPAGTDLAMWDAFVAHWRELRRWSIARAKQCAGHLHLITADGGDPTAVLDWALTRGLADLRDAHRRMQRDIAREAAADRRPGESLANSGVRQMRERYGHALRVIDGGALEGNGDG